jgi:hypothetical protein
LQIDCDKQISVVHERREGRCKHDFVVRNTGHADDQKGGEPHYRWRKLSSRGCHRLDSGSVLSAVTGSQHHRNRDRAGTGDVCDRAARYHPHQAAADHGDLRRPAPRVSTDGTAAGHDEIDSACRFEQACQQHENEHYAGGHTRQGSEYALKERYGGIRHEANQVDAAVEEELAWKMHAETGVQQGRGCDDRDRQAPLKRRCGQRQDYEHDRCVRVPSRSLEHAVADEVNELDVDIDQRNKAAGSEDDERDSAQIAGRLR